MHLIAESSRRDGKSGFFLPISTCSFFFLTLIYWPPSLLMCEFLSIPCRRWRIFCVGFRFLTIIFSICIIAHHIVIVCVYARFYFTRARRWEDGRRWFWPLTRVMRTARGCFWMPAPTSMAKPRCVESVCCFYGGEVAVCGGMLDVGICDWALQFLGVLSALRM